MNYCAAHACRHIQTTNWFQDAQQLGAVRWETESVKEKQRRKRLRISCSILAGVGVFIVSLAWTNSVGPSLGLAAIVTFIVFGAMDPDDTEA